MITVRRARRSDAGAWQVMRHDLWPAESPAEHRTEIEQYLDGTSPRQPWVTLVAEDDAAVVGFAEVSIRPFAEGCQTDRVAYLEGWFVIATARHHGVGRALVAGAEDWARSQGCTELASDADPQNEASVSAHRAIGFDDVGLVRCFRKVLSTGQEHPN